MHILEYVNDLNPETEDLLIQLTFEPVKQQLKRDLEKWELSVLDKSTGGKIGNLKRWHNDIYKQYENGKISLEDAVNKANESKVSHTDVIQSHTERNQSHPIASIAVNVNDNVNVTVIKKEDFSLIRVTELFLQKTETLWQPKYAENEALKFFNFYESNGWKVGKNKMKSLSGAIGGWISRNETDKKNKPIQQQSIQASYYKDLTKKP